MSSILMLLDIYNRHFQKNSGKSQQDQNWSFTGKYWNIRETDGGFNKFFQSDQNTSPECPPQLW